MASRRRKTRKSMGSFYVSQLQVIKILKHELNKQREKRLFPFLTGGRKTMQTFVFLKAFLPLSEGKRGW